VNARYAFELADLAVLLDLDLTEPADQDDIEFIREILLRRSAPSSQEPTDADPMPHQVHPTLHLVPDPTP